MKALIKTKDHIIPISHGGISKPINYVYSCVRCNGLKADRTPDQFAIHLGALLDKPRFKISRDTLILILANTRKLILEIAPYRDDLTKKPSADPPPKIPKLEKPKQVIPENLPPSKFIPKQQRDWIIEFRKRYVKEPPGDFHEK